MAYGLFVLEPRVSDVFPTGFPNKCPQTVRRTSNGGSKMTRRTSRRRDLQEKDQRSCSGNTLEELGPSIGLFWGPVKAWGIAEGSRTEQVA